MTIETFATFRSDDKLVRYIAFDVLSIPDNPTYFSSAYLYCSASYVPYCGGTTFKLTNSGQTGAALESDVRTNTPPKITTTVEQLSLFP